MSAHVRHQYPESEPPEFLYHGTVTRFVMPILACGITADACRYVRLSSDASAALVAGSRGYGKPIVLKIDAQGMCQQGFKFYLTPRQDWLTDYVPERFVLG